MAISKVPGYTQGSAGRGSVYAPAKIVVPKAVGYTGSGWNYGGQTYKIPTNLSVTGLPSITYKPPATVAAGPAAAAVGPGVPQPTVNAQLVDPSQQITEIENEPDYISGLGDYNSRLQGNTNVLNDALRQAVISSGYDWTNSSDVANLSPLLQPYTGVIDQTTRDAAAANPFSTKAQLAQALSRGLTGVNYDLGARGAARSGAAASHAQALNEQAQLQRNNAVNAMLSGLGTNLSTYTQGNQSALDTWQGVKTAVANRLAQMKGASTPDPYSYYNPATGEGDPTNTGVDATPTTLGGQNVPLGGNVNGGTSFYTPSYKPSAPLQKVLNNISKKKQDVSWVQAMQRTQAALRGR
jgi:hypothetical protein